MPDNGVLEVAHKSAVEKTARESLNPFGCYFSVGFAKW